MPFPNGMRKLLLTFGILLAVAAIISAWVMLSGVVENFGVKYAGADFFDEAGTLGRDNTYAQYLHLHAGANTAQEEVTVELFEFEALGEGAVYKDEAGDVPALYTGDNSTVIWQLHIPQSGLYNIRMEYLATPSRGVDIERSLHIDGLSPFSGADALFFSRLWTDAGDVKKDNRGNDIRPSQKEVFKWQIAFFRDHLGHEAEPYKFYMEEGNHTLSLTAINEPVYIKALNLTPILPERTYKSYISEHPDLSMTPTGETYYQKVQGEDAVLRSSPSLYPRYDRSSPATEPYSVTNTVLNIIGGTPWRSAGQWIEWNIDVPEDGYYHITLKGRQNFSRGNLSCRTLFIDGVVPFKEVKAIRFPYGTAWNSLTLADAAREPFRFYLAKGSHTLRLEATLGDMGPVLSQMANSIFNLNQIYRKILVLTGVQPDVYRDYNLMKVYPEVIEAMRLESMRLYKLVDDTVAVTGQKSDRIAVAQTLAVQLEEFVKDPDKITKAFVNFKDNITALGTSMQAMSEIMLDIDCIIVSGVKTQVEKTREGFIDKALHEIRSLVSSYTVDYNTLGNVYDMDKEDALEVWIMAGANQVLSMAGRDQSNVLKTMIDDTFVPNTGIKVNLKLVDPNALLGAVVAGNGPDVVVNTDSWNPVNFALRGAAVDLTTFPDFEQVIADFYPGAYTALELMGGIYGLPETQVCSVLFYRKDVLDEIGLPVPKTWAELIAILPTLQGNNMTVGIPFPDLNTQNLFAMYAMTYQNGGAIYNKEGSRTVIDSEAGVNAFKLYTSLYTDYGLPSIFDFPSRFRSGEMPLGIADYTTFNILAVSAPEIRGLWSFTVLPGVQKTGEDGSIYIDHAVHSQGASCMMIATDNQIVKNNAWTFMKWWVSANSQVRFGREIESVLGASARYPTANKQAFRQLAWSAEQMEIIKRQMEQAVGFREVAGGYFTSRHLVNAVRKVVADKLDPRETLQDYARVINEELAKKRAEFGLDGK